jgi:hypothetical protein
VELEKISLSAKIKNVYNLFFVLRIEGNVENYKIKVDFYALPRD